MSITEYKNDKAESLYNGHSKDFDIIAEGEIPYQTSLDLKIEEPSRVKFRIQCGDAFDFIKTLSPNSVDLVITSPPYWGQRSYTLNHNWGILDEWKKLGNHADTIPSYEWYRANGGVLGLEPLPEWYINHLTEILDQVRVCLKPDGNLWVNIGDTYFARWASIREKGRQGLGSQERARRKTPMGGYRQEKQLLLIPARFAISMQDRRWILRNDLIWYKPNIPPRPETDRLRLAHEHFFHFVKRPTQGRAKYYYNKEYVEQEDVDVVQYNVTAGRNGHTATFPVKLITPRILSSSPLGGVVFDPFCGTGRSLAVAVKHGRNAIGCDVVHDFAQTSREFIVSFAANGAMEE